MLDEDRKNSDENVSSTSSPRDKLVEGELGILLSAIFGCLLATAVLASIVGNVLTCYVINKSRRLQSTTNYFVLALASCGLVVTILMPFVVVTVITERWIFPEALCRSISFLLQACVGSNIFILLSICFDRYYTIIYPLSFKVTRGRAKKMIYISWIVAILLATPAPYLYRVSYTPHGVPKCLLGNIGSNQWSLTAPYLVPITFIEYMVPFFVIWINYYRVIRVIWTLGKHGSRFFQRTTNHVPRAKINILKILLFANFVDFIAVSFFHALRFVQISANASVDLFSIPMIIFFFITLSKPTIYLVLNSNFRRGCREVLCWSKLRCYRQELYAVTTVSGLAKKNYVASVPQGGMGNGDYIFNSPVLEGYPVSSDDPGVRKKPTHQPRDEPFDANDSRRQGVRRASAAFDRSGLITRNAWPIKQSMTSI